MALPNLVDPVGAHQAQTADDHICDGGLVAGQRHPSKLAALRDLHPLVFADEVVADNAMLAVQFLGESGVAGAEVDNERAGREVGLEGGDDEV